VGHMADGNLNLLLDVGKEWAFVVYFEGEDAVLVGELEGGTVNGAVGSCREGLERKSVEGREHGEFELYVVSGRRLEGGVLGG